ncbi:MAG: SRPBCC family protein [Pseudomonadota bacterium]
MKFSTKEDIEVPLRDAFATLSDFDDFERRAMRRGADVTRVDDKAEVGPGLKWEASFRYRGKVREAQAELTQFAEPDGYTITTNSAGLIADFTVSLVALSPARTRMGIALELTPTNLSSRLLLQSLRLAKSTLTRRFKLSVAEYAQSMERQHNGVRLS